MISNTKPIFTEPKCLVTGVEGAGKTLFSVQQADLLSTSEGGMIFQVNVRGADPAHLPKLPFKLDAMAFNDDGSPVIDAETGDHLPMWATLPPGSVIIVDEAHKVYPQRGPGRPPKHIEMLAEGRQHGIRFIYLSQAPASMDGFLRDRISRHYHLERKGNMERATILEFDHCVLYPRTAWQERKDAQVHFWTYPKAYYGWYKSAKSHQMKLRIPWKIFAAVLFIPVVGFVAWNVIDKVGGLGEEGGGFLPEAVAAESSDKPRRGESGERRGLEVELDAGRYLAQFRPVIPERPWSAPAFQTAAITAQPDVYCVTGSPGHDALGEWREASCTCLTEQGTPYRVERAQCENIARHGIYNPHRVATSENGGGSWSERGKPGEARQGPSGVRASTSQGVVIGGAQSAAPETAPAPVPVAG